MWGIHSWRVDSLHNESLMRKDRSLYVWTNWINASAVSHPRWYFIRMTYDWSHPNDLARDMWKFTRLQKDTQIYCGIEMAINDGIKKNTAPLSVRIMATSLRIMGNIHPSTESSLSIQIVNVMANYKHQQSTLYQVKHSDIAKYVQRDFDVNHGYISLIYLNDNLSLLILNVMVNYKRKYSTLSP